MVLPSDIMPVLLPFAQLFSDRSWQWVQVLLVGAILAPGKRTVTAILRVMGLSQEPQFQAYHRILNRVKWSTLRASRILLDLLIVTLLAPDAPLILAADETLERRSSPTIKAVGAFRDAVRSRKKYTVYSFGLRWLCLTLLVPLPWSRRAWACPFLSVLAPGTKADATHGKRHKTSIDWTGQLLSCVQRWQPQRRIVLLVDGGLSSLKLARRCLQGPRPVTLVSRLRLDAGLYDPPAPKAPGRPGPPPKYGAHQPSLAARVSDPTTAWERTRVTWYGGVAREVDLASGLALWGKVGERPVPVRWVLIRDPVGTFEPQALFTTAASVLPGQVVEWFVQRWSEEVTFQEVRTHLGVETQRQWADLAIKRETPLLLGLFSVVVLLGQQLTLGQAHPVRQAAWYTKREATFVDTIALVRRHLLSEVEFPLSPRPAGQREIPRAVLHGLIDCFCYAT